MGYYTTIEDTPKIKKEKIDEAREVLSNTKVILEYYDDLYITKEGDIEFKDDYTKKFYEETRLANALAPFTEDSRFELRGEDGTMWAIHFDGEGGWKYQHAKVEWVDE